MESLLPSNAALQQRQNSTSFGCTTRKKSNRAKISNTIELVTCANWKLLRSFQKTLELTRAKSLMMSAKHSVPVPYWSLVCATLPFRNRFLIILYKYSIAFAVPSEEVKSPTFKIFPQSITIAQGQNAVFTCETDKVPTKGTHHTKNFKTSSSTC